MRCVSTLKWNSGIFMFYKMKNIYYWTGPFPVSDPLFPPELLSPPVLVDASPPEEPSDGVSLPPGLFAGVLLVLSAGGCVCCVLSAGACVPPELSLFTPGTAEKAEVPW